MATTAEQTKQAWLKLIEAARDAGVPKSQLRNFLDAAYVPMEHQMPFHAAARECDRPDGPNEIAQGGARGPGKSHSTLAQIGLDDCQRMPRLKCLFLRNLGKAATEAFEDLVPKVFHRTRHRYIPTRNKLTFPNGSRIVLGGFKDESDIDGYLGIEYDLIAVEEATLISKAKKDKLQGSLRSSKPGWRPRMYLTYNPGGIGHAWAKEQYYIPHMLGKETNTRFIPGRAKQNVYIDKSYHDYLDGLSGWLRSAWRDGNMDISAGTYYTNWRADLHVIPASEIPNPIPPNWTVWLSMDYGFTHWNMAYLFAKNGDGKIFVVDEHAARGWLSARHCEAIDAMLRRWRIEKFRLVRFVAGGDVFISRGTTGRGGIAKTIADEYKEAGWVLQRANMDRISGATKLLELLGDADAVHPETKAPCPIPPRLAISSNCARLIACIPNLEHDPDRPEDVLKVDTDSDGNGGDDPYDGLRYGLMAAPSKGGAFSHDYTQINHEPDSKIERIRKYGN